MKLLAGIVLTFFVISCTPGIPAIDSIQPRIGRMGDTLTIRGKNFGRERGESYVTVAGVSPTGSSYINWQDNLIALKAPEAGESGLVYVYVNGRKSNGALFSNVETLPRPVKDSGAGVEPRIIAISPQSGAIGSLVSITGANFGSSPEGAAVYFSWDAEALKSSPAWARAPGFVEVSETEFGYESWSEGEIRIRVPDGAVSGNMEIRTPQGNSRSVFFEVSGRPGAKNFGGKRSYTISQPVDVKIKSAVKPDSLYLWMPRPASYSAQQNITLLSKDREPLVENYRGTCIFKLDNLVSNSEAQVNLSWQAEVYSIETSVRPEQIRREERSGEWAAYTRSSPLIPADDPLVKNRAHELTGGERSPYVKARLIYDWLIRDFTIRQELAEGNVIDALESNAADPCTTALLYCALLRAAGVPCIPAAGVLVNRSLKTLKHYWAEFWIDGFGWVPVDPVMGAGAVPETFQPKGGHENFYFGNLDNQRIAFSRGEAPLSRITPQGRAVQHNRSYALQELWEEASSGIESYSSLWGDITITGMYVQ